MLLPKILSLTWKYYLVYRLLLFLAFHWLALKVLSTIVLFKSPKIRTMKNVQIFIESSGQKYYVARIVDLTIWQLARPEAASANMRDGHKF